MSIHNLDAMFRPRSVAVVGASRRERTVGCVLMHNLMHGGFSGAILPVNPKYDSVAGVLAYPDVAHLPLVPDLAVLCTPPATVPDIAAALAERGTRALVVLTAGMSRQRDPATDQPLDQTLLGRVRPHGTRVLGPNCVGLLLPPLGLNATFAQTDAAPGKLAFASQSGALCTAVLDWARDQQVGFSAFVSLGDSLDVDAGDVLDWLGSDPNTDAILLYLESVRGARKFLSAARAAARNKPVVAIKAGRVAEGERAAASHTGALAGADDVFDYALRRAGVLRVAEIHDLFAAAATLARVGPLEGERLVIVTNGGGPGVMATDVLVRGGGRLAVLGDEVVAELDRVLPATWSRSNPVDIIGDASPERFAAALRIVAAAPGVDAVLLLYAPTAIAPGDEVAAAAARAARDCGRPVLACWLGEDAAHAARRMLHDAGIPTYHTPADAVNAFLHRLHHRRGQELLMQTPPSLLAELRPRGDDARAAVERARAEEREWLSEAEAKEVLAAFGIPTVPTRVAADPDAAAAEAERLGFPVAVKILSPDVLHKSDVGGVALDLDSPAAVRAAAAAMAERLTRLRPGARQRGFTVQPMARRVGAHELFVGMAEDPVFGPFLVFGRGGVAVEVIADRAVALPPLDMALAREVIGRTRVAKLLAGYRDRPPADLDAIAAVLVRLSQLVVDLPEVVELDVNPLLADDHGVLALDARMRVTGAAGAAGATGVAGVAGAAGAAGAAGVAGATGVAKSGAARLAIRPYPSELEETAKLRSGQTVVMRPIRPEDERAHYELFASFSAEDVRFRFFGQLRQLPHSQMARYTQIDYDREMAFVAAVADRTLGVVRAVHDPDGRRAEFAIIIRSEVKGQGLGRLLLDKMIRHCRQRGTQVLVGRVLPDNARMLTLARDLGFEVGPGNGNGNGNGNGGELEVSLRL